MNKRGEITEDQLNQLILKASPYGDKRYRACEISFKAEDEDQRIIEGWASTPTLDRYNEITEPAAFKKSLPTYMKNPVLYFGHDLWGEPIGKVLDATIKKGGLWVRAQISETEKQLWTKIKEGILKTFSFGYKLLKYEVDEKTEILTIKDLELFEVSVVGIPANPEAMIEMAKSLGYYKDPEHLKKEFNKMEQEALTKKIDDIETKISDLKNDNLTAEEAKAQFAKIHQEFNNLKESKGKEGLSKAELDEFVSKVQTDLMAAVKEMQKEIEQKWVKPAKMVYDTSSAEQAKRLGFDKEVQTPDGFKQNLIAEKSDEAASHLGLKDQEWLIKELQKASDDLLIVGAYLGYLGAPRMNADPIWAVEPSNLKTFQRYKALKAEFFKAMDTATSGEGADWLPTLMSAQLQEDMEVERALGRRLPRFNQPSKSYVWPLKSSGAVAYIVSEATADANAATFTLTTPGTSSITFTAKAMGAGVVTSDEETEDSIIPIIPFIRNELAKAQRDGEETALINGDNSTTHQDTDVAALGTADIRKIFKGLRYDALNTTGAKLDVSDTLTYANLVSIMKLGGKYSMQPGSGFFLVSVDAYFHILSLTQFTGYDVFGSGAVALSGKLPRMIGHEIVPSEFMRNDLDSTGVNGASDNVHTGIIFCNPRGFMVGDRKINTIESDRFVLSGQTLIVAKQRIDFQKMVNATEKPVVIGYNITS